MHNAECRMGGGAGHDVELHGGGEEVFKSDLRLDDGEVVGGDASVSERDVFGGMCEKLVDSDRFHFWGGSDVGTGTKPFQKRGNNGTLRE